MAVRNLNHLTGHDRYEYPRPSDSGVHLSERAHRNAGMPGAGIGQTGDSGEGPMAWGSTDTLSLRG